jgi:hypothetical protein
MYLYEVEEAASVVVLSLGQNARAAERSVCREEKSRTPGCDGKRYSLPVMFDN